MNNPDVLSNRVIHLQSKLYSAFLRDKRVVVVGPAETIHGARNGSIIDSYDVVVRLNSQWPVASALVPDIGRRADVIYHCCNGKSPIANLHVPDFANVRFAWYETNDESLLLQELCWKHGVPCGPHDEIRTVLTERLSTVPNTGTIAITHLLSTELKELLVTGFSFYTTRYYNGYLAKGAHPKYWRFWRKPKSIGMHAFAPQRDYFLRMFESDPRIAVDPALRQLMKDW